MRATQLLAQYRECATASEQSCLATVLESASHTPEPGAIDAEDPTITLLDDLGGLIVLRVEATDLRTQMLTLVRIADQWRIRDAVSVPGA